MRPEPTIRYGHRGIFWRTDFVGIAMIMSGIIFLLVNFNVIPISDFFLNRVLGILFTIMGIIFLFLHGAGGSMFWFVLPAGVFFSLGLATLVVGIDKFFSLFSLVLISIGIGLTFLSIFISRKNNWWFLIPAGSFFGFASWFIMNFFSPVVGYHPVFLLLWVGISFLIIYIYSFQKERMKWSLYTGMTIIIISGIYYLVILLAKLAIMLPLLLILIGLIIPLTVILLDRRK
jgi:hypothetical protein